ncbi:PREDICTED: uncharacterized protein LOC105455745 [Wasmannia auropunctata]|uniref:uncharacterized protein LOC105455745 n=1 Tax=Wasmannia auropunctata TaxID=64793 RepID=UPI0005EE0416|nr:PREDICTED: uncharacterized protein LOC105455745 [Wasmannia auropunctata]
MESLSTDEIIIDIVRENYCIYDKRNVDFKNVKKKEVWQKISENLTSFYGVNMSAEEIEKRWSSLRDMFSRENRRQKLPPSGSGYEPTKEWDLYRNMLFLVPHIAHRRTKTSFVQPNELQNSLKTSTTPTNISSVLQTYGHSNLVSSVDDYCESFQPIEENLSSSNIENEENVMPIDSENLKRPISTFSSCSSTSSCIQLSETSTNFNSNLKSPPAFKQNKKIVPEMDEFAKRRKNKDDEIDRDLMQASKEISAAAKAVSSQMYKQKHEKADGYMFAIEEGLKYIPPKNKTQCVIEVLQIIQKYEERQ